MSILYLIILVLCIVLFNKLFKSKKGIMNFFFIFSILFLVVSIIIYPKNSVDTALDAINTWLFIVIPSLFPFFIGAELLIQSGIIDFIGILLEPLMYPIFRVPGKGSFAFAMSVTSGYPVGASLVSELRENNSISKEEAQRLIAFASTSGPLFMIGAVSIGMLKNPASGVLLSLAHYLSAISVGLLFRYYGNDSDKRFIISKDSYFKRSLNALIKLKNRNSKSISFIMSKSIESAFSSMFMIGGFIIIYSVVIEILNVTNIIPYISKTLDIILPFNLNIDLTSSVLSGLLELTNGCKEIASLNIDLIWKLCIVSFLIGWGGLSVHSQAMSFMSKTDINTKLYLFSKVLHGAIASIYTYFLYIYVFKSSIDSVTATTGNQVSVFSNVISTLKYSLTLELITIALLLIIALSIGIFLTIKYSFKKHI